MAEWVTAALLAVAVVGTVIPLLPGSLLAAAAVVGCAIVTGERAAWIAAAIAVAVLAVGWVAKWLVPARHVSGDVHPWSLAVGGVVGLIGFFVVPVVGLVLGFVGGVFATELLRTRSPALAWPATRQAITAAGIGMLIELASVILAAGLWGTVMVFT